MDFTPQQEAYHTNGHNPQIGSFDSPELGKAELRKLKALIALDPETGKRDDLTLLNRLVKEFGSAAGLLAWKLFFWTSKSRLGGGWIYKSREELGQTSKQGTGQGHRELEKARAILKGEKPWNGRTVRVLEERRPSQRRPIEFRLDLVALAEVLGVELSIEFDPPNVLAYPDEPDMAEFDDLMAGDNTGDPNRKSEPPHEATELPHGTTEPPRRASESPHEAATESTTGSIPERTAETSSFHSALAALAPLVIDEISKDSSTSPLPLRPDIEPDSAKEESASDALPPSPEVERALAAQVQKIVLTETNLKHAALRAYRVGRVEDVAEYVGGELGDLGEEAAPEHVRAVLPGVLAELEEETE